MTKTADMDSGLEQYLSNVGLSTELLQSTSASAPVQGHTQSPSATVSSEDKSSDNAGASQPVADTTSADDEQTCCAPVFAFDKDSDSGEVNALDVSPTADDSVCLTDVGRPTSSEADVHSEDLVQQATEPSDPNSQTYIAQPTPSDDDSSSQSSPRQTLTVQGSTAQTSTCSYTTSQSHSCRSTVVFSTVPRHVDSSSIPLSSSNTSASSQLSKTSCTIMLRGPTADVVANSPTGADGELLLAGAAPAPCRKMSQDSDVGSYTSTIIRCSASSAPTIATSNSKSQPRDDESTAAAFNNSEMPAAPPPSPQPANTRIKTTSNYVSVVKIGSSATERTTVSTTTTTTSAESVNTATFALHSSSTPVSHQVINSSDMASSTPIKSSMKKVSPGHVKNKSVSFSTGSTDDNDNSVTVTAMTTANMASMARRPDAHQLSHNEAIIRLDRDRVDGTVPRRALVSDSGVFCEPDDDTIPPQMSSTNDDIKVATMTAASPSRKTTVIVSGGIAASVKNSAGQPQREHSAELKAPDARASNVGNRARRPSPAYAQHPLIPTATSSSNDVKQTTTKNSTSDVQRKLSDATQANRFSSNSILLNDKCKLIIILICKM